MSGWMDGAKSATFNDVAVYVGISHVRGRTVAPCPSCGAEKRGSSDKRGPVDLHEKNGRELWHCKRCEAGGDPIDLVATVIGGKRFNQLLDTEKRSVWEWFADRGFCDAPRDHRRPATPPAPKAKRIPDTAVRKSAAYTPDGQAQQFWDLCSAFGRSGGSDIAPLFYLLDRGFDMRRVSPLDIVRATPTHLDRWPKWFPGWAEPSEKFPIDWRRFRLAFKAYTPDGVFRSLHFRRTPLYPNGQDEPNGGLPVCEACSEPLNRSGKPGVRESYRVRESCDCGWKPQPKTLWPAGCSSERLLFADSGGVALMRGDPGAPRRILLAEGVTDLLRAATVAPGAGAGVIAFTSGGASAIGEIVCPPDTQFAIATDNDKAGDAYADKVALAMRPRKPLRVSWSDLMGGR